MTEEQWSKLSEGNVGAATVITMDGHKYSYPIGEVTIFRDTHPDRFGLTITLEQTVNGTKSMTIYGYRKEMLEVWRNFTHILNGNFKE